MIKKHIQLVETEGEPKKISCPDELRSRITTFAYCYLQNLGYFEENPCDNDGYTPWYTYPAISFLKDILDPNMKVFEFGSGYSTLFYKNNVHEYFTVEHDIEWAKKILSIDAQVEIHIATESTLAIPESMTLITEFINNFPQIRSNDINHDRRHGLLNMEYVGYASQIFKQGKGYYDIVVIDGMARALCAYLTTEMIKDDGIIILDNSDRWHYNFLQEHLVSKGFNRIDFWGPGYGNYTQWCTSFFSRRFGVKNNKIKRTPTDTFIQT